MSPFCNYFDFFIIIIVVVNIFLCKVVLWQMEFMELWQIIKSCFRVYINLIHKCTWMLEMFENALVSAKTVKICDLTLWLRGALPLIV